MKKLNLTVVLFILFQFVYTQIVNVDIKVFMEGPFNEIDMNTDLNTVGLIPLMQPYNSEPWNYNGTETVSVIPNVDIVDWILVELRETMGDVSTAYPSTIIHQQAAFLKSNGNIVDLDGSSMISFSGTITDNLFIIVWHRNHLAVMSSGPLTETGGIYSWDFTTPEGQAFGIGAQKYHGSVYVMIGGDSDASGIIDMDDKDIDWSNDAGKTDYYPSDLNMDSQVNNPDKNDIWEPNFNATSQLPVPWYCSDQLVDERDGQTYNTVQIGTQCWMTENLNIGSMISGSSNQSNNSTIEKYCYNTNTSNCSTYGGLYQWDEMMQYVTTEGTQGICPTGWHLPTDAEWCTLENYVDAGTVSCSATGWRGTDAGGNLKETGTIHWISPNTGATNSSSFTSLPGGYRDTGGSFSYRTIFAYFWSSSELGSNAWYQGLSYNNAKVIRNSITQASGFSVRCIRD